MTEWKHPPGAQRMVELVRLFPTLQDATCELQPGYFCATEFKKWARQHAYSHGQQFAVAFVLAVYWGKNRHSPGPGIAKFDVVDAFSTWDASHRAAFLCWAHDPWLP